MAGWHIALLVKPLALLVLFFFIRCVAVAIRSRMPDGRLKRALFFSWRV